MTFGVGLRFDTIALQSYLQKIAIHPQEITPNVSLGQTINHIAAVIIPLVGVSCGRQSAVATLSWSAW
jgi:hypothetical protein